MNVPSPTGHLYAYVMVLGAFLTFFSTWASGTVYSAHDAKLLANVDKVLDLNGRPKEQQAMWGAMLAGSKKTTEFVLGVLLITGTIGLITALGGGIAWFFQVQRLEDLKRRLEYEKLKDELDEKRRADKPRIVTSADS